MRDHIIYDLPATIIMNHDAPNHQLSSDLILFALNMSNYPNNDHLVTN